MRRKLRDAASALPRSGLPATGAGITSCSIVVEAEAESVTAAAAARRDHRGAAAVTDDGGRDRRSTRSAAFERVAVVEADWFGQALAARAAGAAKPLRATAPRRARPRRHQEARPDLKLGRRPPRARRPPQPTRASDRRPDEADDRLRVPARDDRRPHAPCLRRSAP